jgi:hypothetical protein
LWTRFPSLVLPGRAADTFDGPLSHGHADTVGRAVEKALAGREFTLRTRVDRLAHLERVA